ncbi:MoxR family ATPase, partial [Vibrio parahaemolyticus]|nr:MoxR family ATPase [Vibrio parahaemolyticus]
MEQTEKSVIGQSHVVRALVIGLLTNGHILLEGLPGTAKTRSVKSLANLLNTSFGRIQFTPDLLPSDVTGTEVYQELDGKPQLHFQSGPIFNSIVLADEVNRAPAKVQAALLEAMAEKQVTAGRHTSPLPELFLVMATQNPIEQEGTYPLPEAQLDRFLLHLEVEYPDAEHELSILRINRGEAKGEVKVERPMLSQQDIFTARKEVLDIHMAETIEQYIVRLVMATRQANKYDTELDKWLSMGVSPRATIALDRCARAHAWLAGRDFVSPEDVQTMAYPVLRHRLLLSYHAQAEGITANQV